MFSTSPAQSLQDRRIQYDRGAIREQGKCLLHCEEQSFHIDVKDGVVELLGYGAQGGIPRNARIREHNVELTLTPA